MRFKKKKKYKKRKDKIKVETKKKKRSVKFQRTSKNNQLQKGIITHIYMYIWLPSKSVGLFMYRMVKMEFRSLRVVVNIVCPWREAKECEKLRWQMASNNIVMLVALLIAPYVLSIFFYFETTSVFENIIQNLLLAIL